MDEQEKKLAKKVGVGVVILVALYYLMSPYQNCVRSHNAAYCIAKTSW